LLGRQTHDQGDGLGGFAGSLYAVEHFVATHRARRRETDTGAAWVFEVSPTKGFGFGNGEPVSQTRWRF
jgi:hypothetical protein